jgi:hypothetical protein
LTVTGDAQIDTNTLVVDSTNNRVGILNASPATALDVTGSITADDHVYIEGSAARLSFGESDTTDLNTRLSLQAGTLRVETVNNSFASALNRITVDNSTGDISFYEDTGTTPKLFWDASLESLGIGTTSLTASDGANIELSSATSSRVILDSTGTGGRKYTMASGLDGSLDFYDYDASAYRMRMDSSGNLLVGKTSASGSTVGAELRAAGTVIATVDGDYPLYLNRKTSEGDIAQFRKDGTLVGSVGIESSGFYVDGEGSHAGLKMFGGAVGPRQNGADIDATIDIGWSSGRFKDLYLSGGAYIGGTGSANKLEDYEEGTWTPYLARWTGGNISATYTAQNGRYTKIGRLVTLSFDVSVSAISSQGSSIAYISGAPFNNAATQNYVYAGTFGQRSAISSSTVAMSCIKHATNNAILFRQHDDFRENVDDNWEVGTMRGSITYEHG